MTTDDERLELMQKALADFDPETLTWESPMTIAMPLTMRAVRCLSTGVPYLGINICKTLGDVKRLCDSGDLMKIRHLGNKTKDEIVSFIGAIERINLKNESRVKCKSSELQVAAFQKLGILISCFGPEIAVDKRFANNLEHFLKSSNGTKQER